MLVAVLIADLLFPDAASLKDKRRRLAGLVARIRANYPDVIKRALHDLGHDCLVRIVVRARAPTVLHDGGL